MALTWKRRTRRVKEHKQKKLLEQQRQAQNQQKRVTERVEKLQAEVKDHREAAVVARKQEARAKTHVDRAKTQGIEPFPKHVELYKTAKQTADAANRRETQVLQTITTVKATAPVVPEVPQVEKISLSVGELAPIALFVLMDLLHLNKWVALAIVGAGSALFYFAEKQGWTDFINF